MVRVRVRVRVITNSKWSSFSQTIINQLKKSIRLELGLELGTLKKGVRVRVEVRASNGPLSVKQLLFNK
jgi:hypothetical protein